MREHLHRLSLLTTGFSNENLKIDDIKINFDLDKSVINSYNDKYKDISEELSGIKRFNVFRYFEDTNMLLPIETFHDEASGRVYAHTTETGTYCLIDMAAWLDSLGFEEYISNELQPVMTYSAERAASSDIDIIFILHSSTAYADFIKDELANVINSAYSHGNSVHMYFISNGGDVYMINGREYAETAEECMNVLRRFRGSAASESVNKAFLAAKGLELRDGSQRHMFMLDGLSMPVCGSANANLNDILKNDVNFGIICNAESNNIVNYNKLANNNVRENIVVFKDFILDQINFADIVEDEEYVITANGLVLMPEDFGDISIDSEQDYDRDGLSDVTEINFDVTGEDGNALITVNDDGSVVLPNFNECVAAGGTFVENGLQRFYDETDDYILGFLDIIKVLPLMSDPTSEDGDGDGILDNVEYSIIQKYSNNMVAYIASDENDEEDDDKCPLGLLSSNTIVDYGFKTQLKAKGNEPLNDFIILGNNEIKKGYTLAREHGINETSNDDNVIYGYLGSDTDTFYIEAFCEYNDEKTVISNEMRINANIYCPKDDMAYTDSDGNNIKVSKKDFFDTIIRKWSNMTEDSTTATPFQGNDKDLFGMEVKVSVNINEVTYDEDKDKKSSSNPNKREITVNGRTATENYDGKYITMNLFDSNPQNKNSITHNGLSSSPEIEIYNTQKNESGKFSYKSSDEVRATAAHEFGHALGLMDAYGFDSKENYYMEPVSYGEVIYDESGDVGHEESGEMMHRSGKVSPNDIEMAIYAKKENMSKVKGSNTGYQFYVPLGRIEQKSGGYDFYGKSKAIRGEYFYRCRQGTDIIYNGAEICKTDTDKIYYFNGTKYILLDSTVTTKKDIGNCFGSNFDVDYYNIAVDLLPNDEEEEAED